MKRSRLIMTVRKVIKISWSRTSSRNTEDNPAKQGTHITESE